MRQNHWLQSNSADVKNRRGASSLVYQTMKISIATLNYKKVQVSVRSGFQFDKKEIIEIYGRLRHKIGLNCLVILSTCNRTEIYLDHTNALSVYEVLDDIQKYKNTNLQKDQFTFIEDNYNAVRYMMEVANGLQSMAYGDKQVYSQIKEAFLISQKCQVMTGTMERIFQAISRTHKRVVNETTYHQGSQSISHLAVSAVKKKFKLRNIPVLVIGAGEIATDLLKYLFSMNFSNVTVINRTSHKAVSLALKYNFQFADYVLNSDFLMQFSVIISCAGSRNLINIRDHSLFNQTFFIDLTTNQSISALDEGTEMITLDHLNLLRESNSSVQCEAIGQVSSIIIQESSTFFQWARER
ncbi:hypothetical protein DBR43_03560 [Pedobacter sp. KBW06]|uniref:hypothetical protein n=1 Tax=Pedobacter sp. KBW06 TaxID=2153359 RepID=UPI000F596377|nr:hypothetical protein [Pedobacter sp. KBW06]RQO74481.1 hypothetical protein DBR43_03560 [Pedobacter sp. KBW06]